MIKRFRQCVACKAVRTENGEDVAVRVVDLEIENARLREALERISKASMPHEEPVSRMIALAALEGKE